MKLYTMCCLGLALVALGGCATPSLEKYAEAANELDPDCYKNVHIQVTPFVLMGYVVPVVGGTYDKVCNPEKAPATVPAPLSVGQVLGGQPR